MQGSQDSPAIDKIVFRQLRPYCDVQVGDLPRGEELNHFLRATCNEGGTQVGQVVTHRGKEFEEDYKKVTSKDHQEIYGGIFNDRVEKVLHTVSTHKTSMSH